MVILMVTPPKLGPGITHDYTNWQLSSSPTFEDENIIIESVPDTENKLVKIFDVDLDKEKEYYARAQIGLSNFLSEWSNIDIILPKDLTSLELEDDIPSYVNRPMVSVDGDINKLDPIFFTISTNEMVTTSNAKHKASTYFITDLDNRPYFIKPYDEVNLTSLTVNDTLLPSNRILKVGVIHHATSNDVSSPGTITVRTQGTDIIKLLNYDEILTPNEDYTFRLESVNNVKKINYSLFIVDENKHKELTSGIIENMFSFTIPGDLLKEMSEFILKVNYVYDDDTETEYNFYSFRTGYQV